jgi:hypothetical protein
MRRIKHFVSFVKENEEGEDKEEYSFEELSPEAQKNALKELWDINIEYSDWHEPIIEDFESEMKEEGVSDIEVSYSGFYSQGDGASFTGEVYDNKTFMKKCLDLKDDEWLDMGDDEKPEDEGSRLRADLLDLGFDSREKLTPDNFSISIIRESSRYSHENTISGNVVIEDVPESIEDEFPLDEYAANLEEMVTKWARSTSKDLYRKLERYYDNLMSDEEVKETIIGNDYKFDKDGNLK